VAVATFRAAVEITPGQGVRLGIQRRYGGRPGAEWAAGDACGIDRPAAGGLIGFWHWRGVCVFGWAGAKAEGLYASLKEVGAGSSTECRKAGLRWCLPGRPPRGCQCLSWPTGPAGDSREVFRLLAAISRGRVLDFGRAEQIGGGQRQGLRVLSRQV